MPEWRVVECPILKSADREARRDPATSGAGMSAPRHVETLHLGTSAMSGQVFVDERPWRGRLIAELHEREVARGHLCLIAPAAA